MGTVAYVIRVSYHHGMSWSHRMLQVLLVLRVQNTSTSTLEPGVHTTYDYIIHPHDLIGMSETCTYVLGTRSRSTHFSFVPTTSVDFRLSVFYGACRQEPGMVSSVSSRLPSDGTCTVDCTYRTTGTVLVPGTCSSLLRVQGRVPRVPVTYPYYYDTGS